FEDKQSHPGYDVQVEIFKLDSGNYAWFVKSRKQGGEWFTLAGGEAKPSVKLAQGQGSFHLDLVASRELYVEAKKEKDIDRATFRYATDLDPIIVDLSLQVDSTSSVEYASNRYADKTAALYFVGNSTDTGASKISYTVGWDNTTAGRADFLV